MENFPDLKSLYSSLYFRFALFSASLIVFPFVSAKNHVEDTGETICQGDAE